jgi:tripeptide aminopeptidase
MRKSVQQLYQDTDWSTLDALCQWVIDMGIAVQQIPAPTFDEEQRAQYIEGIFNDFRLQDVRIDERFNVYGRLVGRQVDAPALMLSAHIDTVFSAETNLDIRREGNLIYGPGLGDNSMGVAGMLGVLKWYTDAHIQPPCDIWFVATSCEEGLGDLQGIRLAYDQLRNKIGGVINLEGLAFGYVFHAGIAVHRLKITAKTQGGHSWIHFGRPNAIHAIGELITQINKIEPPLTPRTTYNVGMVTGGTAINAVATEASIWLDMRSEQQEELDKMVRRVYQEIANLEEEDLQFEVEVVGSRPAGSIRLQHPLVQSALASLEVAGIKAGLEIGSTDANIPLADGCPAVTIGITRGGNAHRLDEFIETQPVRDGILQTILLTRTTADYLSQQVRRPQEG